MTLGWAPVPRLRWRVLLVVGLGVLGGVAITVAVAIGGPTPAGSGGGPAQGVSDQHVVVATSAP